MPSYRVTATVGALAPGVDPETILPTATDAGRELTTVEAWDVGVVRGQARITVRFLAEDNPAAFRVADHVCATTGALADIEGSAVTRRYGNRWYPIRRGERERSVMW